MTGEKCRISNLDLSKSTIGTNFTFSKSSYQTTVQFIEFWSSGKVAHLPLNLEEVFPKLEHFRVQESDIPILRNNLFESQHSWIEHLYFRNNGIQMIEEHAFAELTDLVELDLSQNQLKSLSKNLFHSNRKLYRIDLRDNQINAIEPQTFRDLNELQRFYASGNECNDDTSCIANCNLDKSLRRCYENYGKALKSLNRGIIIFYIY
jgi:Leucine-rich repeat (LRR) protein